MHARVKLSVDMSWYRSAMRAVVVSRSPRVAGNEQGILAFGIDSDDLIRPYSASRAAMDLST